MTTRGKLVLTLLTLAIACVGAWQWLTKLEIQKQPPLAAAITNRVQSASSNQTETAIAGEITETQFEVPKLAAPGTYLLKDNTVEIELSEYAGYAGLIAANGGLAPNDQSFFFQKHGFKVKISLSEEESWSALNSGKMAASATTVDVLAVHGRQFKVGVPALIGFSRGADGVVVRREVKRINQLKGKILATAQFTEADFFIRYLAQEAGLTVNLLPNLQAPPDGERLNLVFCADAFASGDVFLRELKAGGVSLAGCVTWAPKTTEVVKASSGQAHILATSQNLLIIADILVVNQGFAEQHPDKVAGLVHGLLHGNRIARETPTSAHDLIAQTFKWTREQTKAELAKVHLANLPENLAFFSGSIAAAGSFGGIYQSALYSYGSELIKDPVDGDRFLNLKPLQALQQSGEFKDQQIAIAPIRTGAAAALEGTPLLSKDLRFLFAPNSANLEISDPNNFKYLETIKNLLQVSPGSTLLLRGHVDNSKVEEFRRQGGESYVRTMALRSIELSKNRAAEIKRVFVEKYQVDPARIDLIGRGWEEPLSTDSDQNRRVEVQWFTLE